MSQQGSATVVMTAVTGMLAICLVATAALGGLLAARAAAMLAADAAALAAAVATYPATGRRPPSDEAARAAAANGAVLISCVCPVDPGLGSRVVTVRAVVEVDVPLFGHLHVSASSRAEFDPGAWLGR